MCPKKHNPGKSVQVWHINEGCQVSGMHFDREKYRQGQKWPCLKSISCYPCEDLWVVVNRQIRKDSGPRGPVPGSLSCGTIFIAEDGFFRGIVL
jgi:hypothetical protein